MHEGEPTNMEHESAPKKMTFSYDRVNGMNPDERSPESVDLEGMSLRDLRDKALGHIMEQQQQLSAAGEGVDEKSCRVTIDGQEMSFADFEKKTNAEE